MDGTRECDATDNPKEPIMFDNFLCGSLFALIATIAVVAGAPASHTAPRLGAKSSANAQVVVMPAVQVIGKRLPEFAAAPEVVRLPMVTVTGRRDMRHETIAVASTD